NAPAATTSEAENARPMSPEFIARSKSQAADPIPKSTAISAGRMRINRDDPWPRADVCAAIGARNPAHGCFSRRRSHGSHESSRDDCHGRSSSKPALFLRQSDRFEARACMKFLDGERKMISHRSFG